MGNGYVELSRPLPIRLRALSWNVRIVSNDAYGRTLTGVESLTLSMAWSPFAGAYEGHSEEGISARHERWLC